MTYQFPMLENEYWWGGTTVDGNEAPFHKGTHLTRDFRVSCPNQTMPMYLSNKGRCIWSETPFAVTIAKGVFTIEGDEVVLETYGTTLREAYRGAMAAHFPPEGNILPADFFTLPQYNTWMQMTYDQTQEGVLAYARAIVAHGFRPGVLMIDEGWQKDYGEWVFDRYKFPDPKAMVDELHDMGFKVMLWVVPNVRPDGKYFIQHAFQFATTEKLDNYFLRTDYGHVGVSRWWNGYSAAFDMTKDCDRRLLGEQLDALMADYGIDGFKFDGGSVDSYTADRMINGSPDPAATAADRNGAWNDFGTAYAYHEFKDTFKGGGKRVIQRICDRNHKWDETGLGSLIPNALLQGVIGHAFVCPDMIGGGEWTVRELGQEVDQELFVRMAQCAALFPMMQFSWAPWEAVDDAHLALIKAAHDLHLTFAPLIMDLVEEAYRTGEPMMRPLCYTYPDGGYEQVTDAFMLGDAYLVAPVVVKGQTVRSIPLPPGRWLAADGKEYIGGQTVDLPVTLADLPYFKKIG